MNGGADDLDDERTYEDELEVDRKAERRLAWKELLALLIVALVVVAHFLTRAL